MVTLIQEDKLPEEKRRRKKTYFLPRSTRQQRLSPRKLMELVRHAKYLSKSIRRLNNFGLTSLSSSLADHLQELLSNNPYLRKRYPDFERLIETTDAKNWPSSKLLSDIGISNVY
ncbi:MAG: hypothetical protein ACD_5C00034G0002 [uncultured bacterium]|nr:MAG: hypothetical protein ACD_5C00034G0002 [uncultured bacterium]